MKSHITLSGKVTHIDARPTRFGPRATAVLTRTNHATGEVTETIVKAWNEAALALAEVSEGADAGLTGGWKRTGEGETPIFLVSAVSEVRIVDPASVDLSRYL